MAIRKGDEEIRREVEAFAKISPTVPEINGTIQHLNAVGGPYALERWKPGDQGLELVRARGQDVQATASPFSGEMTRFVPVIQIATQEDYFDRHEPTAFRLCLFDLETGAESWCSADRKTSADEVFTGVEWSHIERHGSRYLARAPLPDRTCALLVIDGDTGESFTLTTAGATPTFPYPSAFNTPWHVRGHHLFVAGGDSLAVIDLEARSLVYSAGKPMKLIVDDPRVSVFSR